MKRKQQTTHDRYKLTLATSQMGQEKTQI